MFYIIDKVSYFFLFDTIQFWGIFKNYYHSIYFMIDCCYSLFIIIDLLLFDYLYLYFTLRCSLDLLFFAHTINLTMINYFCLYLGSKTMEYLNCFSKYSFDYFLFPKFHLIKYPLENLKLDLYLLN